MKLYAIRQWEELFENNRSRSVTDLRWVKVPNRHDGENYTAIMSHKQGSVIFSSWILLLQVASKCKPRGVLVRDNGLPHTPLSLSLKTRAPKEWFILSLDYLEHNTDWLECKDVTDERHLTDTRLSPDCHPSALEGKGREGNGIERREGKEHGADAPPKALGIQVVFDSWNGQDQFPHCLIISDKRRRALECRLRDPFFSEHWSDALKKACASSFLRGENNRNWRASFDWFIQPDTCAKIMEGKYDNGTYRGNGQQGFSRSKGTANEGRAKDYNLEAIRKARSIPDVQRPAT